MGDLAVATFVKRLQKSPCWAAREWSGKTQEATIAALAERGIDCSQSTLWRWESGKIELLSLPLATLEALVEMVDDEDYTTLARKAVGEVLQRVELIDQHLLDGDLPAARQEFIDLHAALLPAGVVLMQGPAILKAKA